MKFGLETLNLKFKHIEISNLFTSHAVFEPNSKILSLRRSMFPLKFDLLIVVLLPSNHLNLCMCHRIPANYTILLFFCRFMWERHSFCTKTLSYVYSQCHIILILTIQSEVKPWAIYDFLGGGDGEEGFSEDMFLFGHGG